MKNDPVEELVRRKRAPWKTASTQERFDRFVDRDPNTGCWLWNSTITQNGYGAFNLNGRTQRAHRVAWALAYGPIPPGEGAHGTCVCHRCDVKLCVNPDHLFLGTQADNRRDMEAKGRAVYVRGERHGSAKLTAEDVRAIRAAYVPRLVTQRQLAARYGVDQMAIQCILSGKTWTHV